LEKIDVVLPFHRVDKFLAQAIDSIQSQLDCQTNLILIDDRVNIQSPTFQAPKDAILKKTGGVGYAKALEAGLNLCESSYVAFQDSDDISSISRLSTQLKVLKESDADIVFCRMKKINPKGRFFRVSSVDPLISDLSTESLLLGSFGANSTWIIRQDKLKGFFQFSYQSLDWASALVGFPSMKVKGVDAQLYFYRKHEGQMTAKSEYNQTAFSEIYPLWAKLNAKLELPFLSQAEAAAIAFPSFGGKWTPLVQNWIECFLAQTVMKSGGNSTGYEAIIGQRMIQSILNDGIKLDFLKTQKYIWSYLYSQVKVQPSG
jgi:glycosyltransferase involved in cell wall biosynthesis